MSWRIEVATTPVSICHQHISRPQTVGTRLIYFLQPDRWSDQMSPETNLTNRGTANTVLPPPSVFPKSTQLWQFLVRQARNHHQQLQQYNGRNHDTYNQSLKSTIFCSTSLSTESQLTRHLDSHELNIYHLN